MNQAIRLPLELPEQVVAELARVLTPLLAADDGFRQEIARAVTEAQEVRQAPRRLYGAEAAAKHVGIPVHQFRKLVAGGDVPHFKPAQRLIFDTGELDEWLERHREGALPGLPVLRAV